MIFNKQLDEKKTGLTGYWFKRSFIIPAVFRLHLDMVYQKSWFLSSKFIRRISSVSDSFHIYKKNFYLIIIPFLNFFFHQGDRTFLESQFSIFSFLVINYIFDHIISITKLNQTLSFYLCTLNTHCASGITNFVLVFSIISIIYIQFL